MQHRTQQVFVLINSCDNDKSVELVSPSGAFLIYFQFLRYAEIIVSNSAVSN